MASALTAFKQSSKPSKVQPIVFDDEKLYPVLRDFADKTAAAKEIEDSIGTCKTVMRDSAFERFTEHNVASSEFNGNVVLRSPDVEVRVNFNNGYKATVSDAAIEDLQESIGKSLKGLFVKTTQISISLDSLNAEERKKFEAEFAEFMLERSMKEAVTVKSGNVVAPDFNQKAAKLLTKSELAVLDVVLKVPTTMTVTKSEVPAK